MEKINVEKVFTTTSIPTYTYVEPAEYNDLLVAVRTPGKGIVVEGPSGIGKTTSIVKILSQLHLSESTTIYSARKVEDREKILMVASGNFSGIAIVDDFHRLDLNIQERISNLMKVLADEGDLTRKIIVIGINKVGDSLITFSPDLNNRISTIRFESNSDEKVRELILLGEKYLNICISNKDDIVDHVFGSFHLAQLLCQKTCIQCRILETQENFRQTDVSYNVVESTLLDDFARLYYDTAKTFVTGKKLRREGRAPYLHILKWLSESSTWSISLRHEIAKHPNEKASVSQVIDKGYLTKFLNDTPKLQDYIHFDSTTEMLSIEDPKFMFYLRSLNWNSFSLSVGYLQFVTEPKYDFALSFAGTEREIAESIAKRLSAFDIAVFYDKNEQADILSQNVEDYLTPIYHSEALYVVPLLSRNYPKRVWTRIESTAFKSRFMNNAVIPIWFTDSDESMFDESKKYGGLSFDPSKDYSTQIDEIVVSLKDRIAHFRAEH